MRQRIWRRLVAAAAGVVAAAGSGLAQDPAAAPPLTPVVIPVVMPAGQPAPPVVPVPSAPVVVAQPAPVPAVPFASPGVVVGPGPGAVVVPGNGGNGTAARGFVMSAAGGYYGTACQTGHNCNNGCGSLASDAGFVLGSCKSFFAPCGPGLAGCGHGHKHGCGHGLFGRSPCPPAPIYGTGPAGPFNPCCYDSYLNH